jgi:glutaminyl-peptide cyclotransferase
MVGLAGLIVGVAGFLAGAGPLSFSGRKSTALEQGVGAAKALGSGLPSFDGERAFRHLAAQTTLGPRPTGSEASWNTGEFIIAELRNAGWSAEQQEFIFKGVRGRNIIGRQRSRAGALPDHDLILLGAHYDTRPGADRDVDSTRRSDWIDGANDGASGVSVLLELARVLEKDQVNRDIWLLFLDAEDRGQLSGWPFSVGARHLAARLAVDPDRVVIVDMVGDVAQNIYFERLSNQAVSQELWAIASQLGYGDYFIPEARHTIIDDHIPFLERNIPAVDIIDFDYPYWHTVEDTLDKVTPESLERVGRTLEVWLEKDQ